MSRPIHLAVVTETWSPEINGVARTIKCMVDGLMDRGHIIELTRPRQSRQDTPVLKTAFSERLVRGFRAPGYPEVRIGWPAYFRLKHSWRANPPDLVQIVTEGPLGYSAQSAALKLGIPVISDFHTRFDQYSAHYGMGLLQRLAGPYLRRLHNRSRTTLVPTPEMADILSNDGYRHLDVVARGIDCEQFNPRARSSDFRQSLGISHSDLLVGLVARLAREKNLDLAVQAFREIRKHNPRAQLMMVGDGPERSRLQKQHLDVHFVGMKVGFDLARHYASLDLFLAPSKSETFGNVTLEAMASGLPVVCFNYAAARLHIEHTTNGMAVPMNNDRAFIDAAVELSLDTALRKHMGKLAHASVQKLDWERIIEQLESLMINQLGRDHHGFTAATQ